MLHQKTRHTGLAALRKVTKYRLVYYLLALEREEGIDLMQPIWRAILRTENNEKENENKVEYIGYNL